MLSQLSLVGGISETRQAVDDGALDAVEAGLYELAGSRDDLELAVARALRISFDSIYDGQRTGRYSLDQLSKTEKANCGSVVEIWLQRALRIPDGNTLDFTIGGFDVDCKFSHRANGWMLPPEVLNNIAMVVTADDRTSQWSLGLVRVIPERVSAGTNRDLKTTLNANGREAIRWLFTDAPLPANALLQIAPSDARWVTRDDATGQSRVNDLFRRAQGKLISRNVIATVARQDDFMKRVRSNGGARDTLAAEGIALLGHYKRHQELARSLGLPVPSTGETVSARLAIEGDGFRIATRSDAIAAIPLIPHT